MQTLRSTAHLAVNLTVEELHFLRAQLARHIEHVETELAHTDSHDLQHKIASDLKLLDFVDARLAEARIVDVEREA